MTCWLTGRRKVLGSIDDSEAAIMQHHGCSKPHWLRSERSSAARALRLAYRLGKGRGSSIKVGIIRGLWTRCKTDGAVLRWYCLKTLIVCFES